MTDINKLAEQHILEHQSRLNHIDELLERASEAAQSAGGTESQNDELAALRRERDEFSDQVQAIKNDPAAYWQKNVATNAGPMAVWDAIAERLETLLERLQGKSSP